MPDEQNQAPNQEQPAVSETAPIAPNPVLPTGSGLPWKIIIPVIAGALILGGAYFLLNRDSGAPGESPSPFEQSSQSQNESKCDPNLPMEEFLECEGATEVKTNSQKQSGSGGNCDLSKVADGLKPYPNSILVTEGEHDFGTLNGKPIKLPYVTCHSLGADSKAINDYFVSQLKSLGWSARSSPVDLGRLGTAYDISGTKSGQEININITSAGYTVGKKF